MSAVMNGPVPDTRSSAERLRLPLMIGGIAVAAAVALWFWLAGGRYMSTEDAYVQAARASISSNVAGQVAEVLVHDNQRVKKGDVLFRLRDDPYRIAVAAAQAKLDSARLQVISGKAAYRQQLALLHSAQESMSFEDREYRRQADLLKSGVVTRSRYDQAKHAYDGARLQANAAQQQVASVLAMLAGDPDLPPEQHPAVQAAQAELDRAKLELSYTQITAPDDGIVTKVEQLQPGDAISAGAPVFALVSTRDVWVEANFKESQLTGMRAGQSATVDIDTYPDHDFHAHVVSIAPGTGSQFSALPPENATGNWVKVVQRLPVRLEIEDAPADLPMHAGLSATVKVDTQSGTAGGNPRAQ